MGQKDVDVLQKTEEQKEKERQERFVQTGGNPNQMECFTGIYFTCPFGEAPIETVCLTHSNMANQIS